MDENVNSITQEEMPPRPTKPADEVPRLWEAIKILGKALVLYILFDIIYLIVSDIIRLPKDLNLIYMTAIAAYIIFLILKWVYRGGYNLEKTFRLFTFPKKCILPVSIIALSLTLLQFQLSTMLGTSSNTMPSESLTENQILLTFLLKIILPIILSITIVPISEELIHRGILLTSIENQWGLKAAIITTSLLFGIMHIKFPQSISTAIASMLIAWLVYKTNSILCGILIHLLHNAIIPIYGILSFSSVLGGYELFSNVYPWSFGMIVILFNIIMIIIGVWWFNKILNLSSQRPITFISDYFRRKNEICTTSSVSSEIIDQ